MRVRKLINLALALLLLSGYNVLPLRAAQISYGPDDDMITTRTLNNSTVYQEDAAGITFTGNWTRVAEAEASGGWYAVSKTPGDTVQFMFNGPSVVLSRTLSTDGGQADVTIDGVDYGSLEFYFTETQKRWQVPAFFDTLGPGEHTLTLTVRQWINADSIGHKVMVDAFIVPSPYTPTLAQQQAVARVNEYRQITGLPLAQGVQAMHQAAQSHAEFYITNQGKTGVSAHVEVANRPGFTGQGPMERARYFGYTGYAGEDVHFLGDPVASVDGWMETVYHRNIIMGYSNVDIGYGIVNDERGAVDTLNTGSRANTQIAPDERLIYTYPADGQQNVPPSWNGGEHPDPLPEVYTPVGYPLSLYIAHPSELHASVALTAPLSWAIPTAEPTHWNVHTSELRDANGDLLPIYVLEKDTDPHMSAPDVVFLIARAPLTTSTAYTAHVAGTDSRNHPFEHTWSFTTRDAAVVSSISMSPGTCSASVSWRTAGKAKGYIEYGPTPDYGERVAGQTQDKGFHWANLNNLKLNTTHHYRIVTKAEGQIHRTEDHVFTTIPPTVHEVPDTYATIQDAIDAAGACDIVQISAGTYLEHISTWKPVTLIGAGWQNTIIDAGGSGRVLRLPVGSVIEGITLQNSGREDFDAGIWATDTNNPTGTLTIRASRVTGNQTGIWGWCFNTCQVTVTLEHTLIDSNINGGLNANERPIFILRNTTIVDNGGTGLILNNAASLVENSIIVGNLRGLDNSVGATTHYNNVWGNGQNYSGGGIMGEGSLSVDPRFRDRAGHDYSLHTSSPILGHGMPTGIDMGALPLILREERIHIGADTLQGATDDVDLLRKVHSAQITHRHP